GGAWKRAKGPPPNLERVYRRLMTLLVLAACDSGATLEGAVEKGPFILGSTVLVSELDSAATPTGNVYATHTADDLGRYGLTVGYRGAVGLQAEGFAYDE